MSKGRASSWGREGSNVTNAKKRKSKVNICGGSMMGGLRGGLTGGSRPTTRRRSRHGGR